MNKILLGAAAAFAIAAPAYANTGYLGASYTRANVDPGNVDSDSGGIEGAVSFSTAPGLSAAFDGSYVRDKAADSALSGTLHIFDRGDNHLLGVFGGVSHLTGGGSTNTFDTGVEGQWYMSNLTLGAAATYVKNNDLDASGWGVNGSAKFFLSDNFSLGGSAGWFNIDTGGASTDNAWAAGLGAEYQFSSTPFSLLANYSHFADDDAGVKADAFTVGVRYNFHGSLKERNHTGGDLSGLSGVGALRL